jgi:multimeric flavodoxin WrbA
MTKVLILYYSAYGHMERMAQAVAEGVRDAGVEADIKRVPELVSEEVAKQSGFKYSFQGQSTMDEISGCSPYGASTITKPDGSRMPSENELAGARFQGRHVAQIAGKLKT